MRWRADAASLALMLGAASVALWPAVAQRAPESILPPGFGQPPPANQAVPRDDAPAVVAPAVSGNTSTAVAADNGSDLGGLVETDSNDSVTAAATPEDLPPEARRSLDGVGLVSDDTGFGRTGFGQTDGTFLATLMRELSAPIASRWASIVLRRALVAPSAVPPGTDGADWVAARALLLVKMGEADMARALVARVDSANFTPALYEAALQAALATGDPAALCPIADRAADLSDEAAWPLAQAMCAGLSGESGTASALIDQVRDDRVAGGIDVLLAEKVVGAATNTRRAVTIQWDGVDQLTAWRYGTASATGVVIPPRLFASVGPQVQAWQARAPLYDPLARAGAAERAAVLGVFSSAALVDAYSGIWDATDPAERSGTTGEILRMAYGGDGAGARLAALRSLWDAGNGVDRYARQVLTARAAAAVDGDAVSSVDDVDRLIEAMLAAGLDLQATRLAGRTTRGTLGWALLAVGAPQAVAVDAAAIRSVPAGGDSPRTPLLIAALAGLGRLSTEDTKTLDGDYALGLGRTDSWTRALDAAVQRREAATVAVLIAAGMQTGSWAGVPPSRLYRIVAALSAVGLGPEARMIAAEAVTRA